MSGTKIEKIIEMYITKELRQQILEEIFINFSG